MCARQDTPTLCVMVTLMNVIKVKRASMESVSTQLVASLVSATMDMTEISAIKTLTIAPLRPASTVGLVLTPAQCRTTAPAPRDGWGRTAQTVLSTQNASSVKDHRPSVLSVPKTTNLTKTLFVVSS